MISTIEFVLVTETLEKVSFNKGFETLLQLSFCSFLSASQQLIKHERIEFWPCKFRFMHVMIKMPSSSSYAQWRSWRCHWLSACWQILKIIFLLQHMFQYKIYNCHNLNINSKIFFIILKKLYTTLSNFNKSLAFALQSGEGKF